MELDCIILSEISQSEKDKYYMISVICGFKKQTVDHRGREEKNKIKREKEANYQRLLNTKDKLRVAGGWRGIWMRV